jgi:hypothetical protein
MIKFIKIIHTLIWAIMVAAVLYILYCGLTKQFNLLLWISIGLIFLEGLALLLNRWVCPVTSIAKRYTTDRADNFDIYLPIFLTKYTKTVFSILFIIGLFIVIFNMI